MKTACWMVLLLTAPVLALQQEPKKPATPPSTAPPPPTHSSKPVSDPTAPTGAKDKGSQLNLTGLKLTVPAGWETQTIQPGAMAPKAVYQIPPLKPGEEPATVRITYFPEMKGKDDMNLDRWIAQVTRPDGALATRTDAKIEKTELGNIRLTTVDVSGNVKMTMRDTPKPEQRMIAAIIDHPKGPHFVVVAGPAASMKTWEADIMKFLKSAEVTDK